MSDFNKYKDGHQAYCRECSRFLKILNRYGITRDQYNQMLVSQNNTCDCCKEPFGGFHRGRKRHPAVDHNHKTGKIRALICDRCNWNIGSFEANDGPGLIKKVLEYVSKHSNSQS